MSQQLAVSQSHELNQDMIHTLTQAGVIPANTPAAQIQVFAQVCKDKGLSPFSKEIYLMCYGGVYSRIVGIDGFRKIAVKSGKLAGCDDVKFNIKSDGSFLTATELIEKKAMLLSATVTVYRIVSGIRVPFTHTAVFQEFTTGKQKWNTMPHQMIAKVAEAFAYRKGFADEVSGLSVEEELGAIQDLQITTVTEPKEPVRMNPQYKGWAGCCNAIKTGVTTVSNIEKLYELSDEDKAYFLSITPVNPHNLPELTPESERWQGAKESLQSGKTTLDAILKKLYVSPQNIERLKNDAI